MTLRKHQRSLRRYVLYRVPFYCAMYFVRVYAILEQMSEVIGFELKPTPDTSLSQMIEYGLSKHLDR